MSYRLDIQGLRALAVVPVVLYHAEIRHIPGGFVGVDIFFVISGFLIGGLIQAEIAEGRFSLAGFYERRLRRIFPALVVMAGVTTLFAWAYFTPMEMRHYGQSLIAAILSVSNIFFWQHTNYFSAQGTQEPLLHTWSLSVEEQFYLFLPMFLVAAHRFFPAWRQRLIIAVMVVSFGASSWEVFQGGSAAFYLLTYRAWELLMGTLLATGTLPPLKTSAARNLAASIGLLLILSAFFTNSVAKPFPGLAALPPCLGTALVIAAGTHGTSFVGRALSWRPIVFLGTISYSLYLWHWPLIVFQRLYRDIIDASWDTPVKLLIVVLSVLLAWLSWRFVETPFQRRQLLRTRRPVFLAAAASAVALSGGALLLQSVPSPTMSAEVVAMAAYADYPTDAQFRTGSCFIPSEFVYEDFKPSTCLAADPRRPNILLIGDSHAAHLWYGLNAALPDANIMQATASGCRPTISRSGYVPERCARLMEFVFNQVIPNHPPDRLVMAGQWAYADMDGLARTLDRMNALHVPTVLIGPALQYDAPLPILLVQAMRAKNPALVSSRRISVTDLDAKMAALAASKAIPYVSLVKVMCPGGTCMELAAPGVPMEFDTAHLTREGSIFVARAIAQDRALWRPAQAEVSARSDEPHS